MTESVSRPRAASGIRRRRDSRPRCWRTRWTEGAGARTPCRGRPDDGGRGLTWAARPRRLVMSPYRRTRKVVRACNATSSPARSLYAAADRSRRAGAPARSSAAGREERRVLARPEVGPWRRLDGRSTALRAGTDRARGHRARTLAGGVATDPESLLHPDPALGRAVDRPDRHLGHERHRSGEVPCLLAAEPPPQCLPSLLRDRRPRRPPDPGTPPPEGTGPPGGRRLALPAPRWRPPR